MGTKHLLAATGVAVLVGGVSQGLAQSSTPDAGPRADRNRLAWMLPIEIEGGRVLALEIELVASDELEKFLGESSTADTKSGSVVRGMDRETVFWQSIADRENATAFEAYLERWPEGTFARLAEIRLEEIRRSSPVDTRLGTGDSRAARGLLSLLRRQGAVSQPDENGWTLLHYAAVLDLPDLVGQLLDEGGPDGWLLRQQLRPSEKEVAFNVDARLEDDGRPLSSRLRRVLRRLSLDFGDWTRDGETPLHLAASVNAPDVAEELLAGGADVQAKTVLDWTALHYAAWADAADVAVVLLARGADVEATATGGWTPLHLAAWADNIETAAVLLEHDAGVVVENDDCETPLDLSNSNRMRTVLSRWLRR